MSASNTPKRRVAITRLPLLENALLLTRLKGRTVVSVEVNSLEDEHSHWDELTIKTQDGFNLVLRSADSENYCSWLEVLE